MNNSFSKILLLTGVLLVFGMVVVIFFAFSIFGSISSSANAQEPTPTAVPTTPQVPVNEPITISKILANPVVYKDLQLTLEGKIVGWVTKNAIIVSETGEKNSGKRLLVISSQKFRLPDEVPANEVALGETVNVSFTGTTAILALNQDDRRFGDELESRELRNFNNQPVVFVSSVAQK